MDKYGLFRLSLPGAAAKVEVERLDAISNSVL